MELADSWRRDKRDKDYEKDSGNYAVMEKMLHPVYQNWYDKGII